MAEILFTQTIFTLNFSSIENIVSEMCKPSVSHFRQSRDSEKGQGYRKWRVFVGLMRGYKDTKCEGTQSNSLRKTTQVKVFCLIL